MSPLVYAKNIFCQLDARNHIWPYAEGLVDDCTSTKHNLFKKILLLKKKVSHTEAFASCEKIFRNHKPLYFKTIGRNWQVSLSYY